MDQAEGFFKQALQADPNSYSSHIELGSLYLNQAQAKIPQAEEQARLAVKIDSRRSGAYAILVVVAVKQSRWKDFDQILNDSEKYVPDDFGPHYQAGKAILVSGDAQQLSRAESCFRKYLTQEPEAGSPPLAAAHWRLGLVFEKQGRKEEARAELQSALHLDPTFKEARQDLKRLK
jgi:tetratricopeptide (TPR) repeat protein